LLGLRREPGALALPKNKLKFSKPPSDSESGGRLANLGSAISGSSDRSVSHAGGAGVRGMMGAANSRSRVYGESMQSGERKTAKKVNFGPDGAAGSAISSSNNS